MEYRTLQSSTFSFQYSTLQYITAYYIQPEINWNTNEISKGNFTGKVGTIWAVGASWEDTSTRGCEAWMVGCMAGMEGWEDRKQKTERMRGRKAGRGEAGIIGGGEAVRLLKYQDGRLEG